MDIIVIRTVTNASGTINMFLGDVYSVSKNSLVFLFIFRALSKLVAQKPDTWDEYLDAVMFGLRTKKQMTTKFSPFFLMFEKPGIPLKCLKISWSVYMSQYESLLKIHLFFWPSFHPDTLTSYLHLLV